MSSLAQEGQLTEQAAELARAREALAQQARRTADVAEFGRRALAGGDLGRMVEDVVPLVARSLAAEFCRVRELLPDGRVVGLRAIGWPVTAETPARQPEAPDRIEEHALLVRNALIVEDASTEERFPLPGRNHGIQSGMCVLVRSYRTFGFLEAYSTRPRAFRREDLDYLQSMANVLATAADRREAERISLGQTAALVSTLNALASGPDLELFLRQTLGALVEHLQAGGASLWLYDAKAETFRLHTAWEMPPGNSHEPPPRVGALWQEMLRTRRPIVVEDVGPDSRLAGGDWWAAKGTRTVVLIPMLLGDEPTGLFRVRTAEPRGYRMEEMDLAQALAQQATLAIEWARLAERRHEAAIVEERNRMAREIHDTLAQAFTGIIIQLEAAEYALANRPEQTGERLTRARDLAKQGLAEARRSVWALRPQALEADGLMDALAGLLRQMTGATSVQASFQAHGVPRPLPPAMEHDLLRIGQEAVTNALRHASAKTLRMELSFEEDHVGLTIKDDGQGFDPGRTAAGHRFGLTGMRERADRFGGRLTIHSGPGAGTEVKVVVPTPDALPGVIE
jgi:signal transduction histidine kinase